MRALLQQQGLTKILDGKVSSTSSKEEIAELEKKNATVQFYSLSNGVLREVPDEDSAARLWKNLESLYVKKSFTNRLYLKQRLCTLKMQEGGPKRKCRACKRLQYSSRRGNMRKGFRYGFSTS